MLKKLFNGASETVKDEALSTFRFYKQLFTFGIGLFLVFLFVSTLALLKVIFGG